MSVATELALLIKADTSQAEKKMGGLGKALAGAGIGVAAGKAAVAVAGIGTAFDDVYDGIAVKTGATGTELAGLQQSFRDVVAAVPTDFGSAGDAIGTLNQRLGLTGQPLTDMATQMANLSRITGTDIVTNSDAAADAISRWNIPAGEQSELLDTLFSASQNSGVGFDQLASDLGRFAPQLQAMGMDTDTAAALLGTMGQAGIDTAAVMPGLTKAMSNMAKDGIEPAEGLAQLFDKVKAEGPNSAAAMEAFGNRGGMALADMITSGKLNYQQFADTLATNAGTISDTATSTDDMQQKFDLLKNKVMLAAEGFAPLGMSIAPFASMLPMLGGAIGIVVPWLLTLGATILTTVVPAFIAMVVPILPIILAILALIAIGVLLYKHWDDVKAAAAALKDWLAEKWEAIRAAIAAAIEAVRAAVTQKWEEIKTAISTAVEAIHTFITEKWNAIKETITGAVENIRVAISEGWDRIKEYLSKKLEDILSEIVDRWEEMKSTIDDALERIKGIVEDAWEAIKRAIDTAMDAIKTLIRNYIEAWKKLFEIGQALYDIAKRAWERLKTAVSDAMEIVKKLITNYIEGWKKLFEIGQELFDKAKAAFGRVKDAIEEKLKEVIDRAKVLAGDIVEGIKSGFEKAWNFWIDKLKGLIDLLPEAVKKLLNIGSPSKVFMALGEQTAEGFRIGFEKAWGRFMEAGAQLAKEFVNVIGGVVGGTSPSMGAAMSRAYGGFATKGQTAAYSPMMGAGQSLMDYIKTGSFGQISQAQLAEWMARMGFDAETIAAYRDLHKMREGGKWKTREAALLHRRRTILTGGDWTGAGRRADVGQDTRSLLSLNPVSMGAAGRNPLFPKDRPSAFQFTPLGSVRGLAKGDPIYAQITNDKFSVETDIKLTTPIAVVIKIGERELTSIAVEVEKIIAKKLPMKPLPGTP